MNGLSEQQQAAAANGGGGGGGLVDIGPFFLSDAQDWPQFPLQMTSSMAASMPCPIPTVSSMMPPPTSAPTCTAPPKGTTSLSSYNGMMVARPSSSVASATALPLFRNHLQPHLHQHQSPFVVCSGSSGESSSNTSSGGTEGGGGSGGYEGGGRYVSQLPQQHRQLHQGLYPAPSQQQHDDVEAEGKS